MDLRSTRRSLEVFRGPVFFLLVLSVLAAGCDRSVEKEEPVPESAPLRPITEVMNDNVDRIMALDEVMMVAIGELEDGTPCLKIYVKYKSDVLAEEIGVELEGHPVEYIISDEIRPMD